MIIYYVQWYWWGIFVFEIIFKYMDEDGEICGYEIIVNFQLDDCRYYLYYFFFIEEVDCVQVIKEAFRVVKEMQGYNWFSDESLLDVEGMYDIRFIFVQVFNDIEFWVENCNGYFFKKFKYFGCFWLNL